MWILLLIVAITSSCWANPNLLHYGSSTADQSLTDCDDCNTGAQTLQYGAVRLFGHQLNYFAAHSNGYVTFPDSNATPVSYYNLTPSALPALRGDAMVAPFWADVNLRESGTLYYRESQTADDLDNATLHIRRYDGDFTPTSAIVVTWDNVGYFGGHDLLNTFQMVVAKSTGKTYMILLYQTIEWTTGNTSEGTNVGLGGIPASAGASSGSGDGSVTLQGSGTSSVLQLPTLTNNGEPGVFVFRIDTTNSMDIHFFQPPCHHGTNADIECNNPDTKQVVTKQQQRESEMLDKKRQEQEEMVKEIEIRLEQLLDTSSLTRH